MFHHIQIVLMVLATPFSLAYTVCLTPCLALLRFFGLRPPPADADDVDMSGKICVVTGANTGIGGRTAFHLAKMGAKVVMACRSVERGEKARAQMTQELAMLGEERRPEGVKPGMLEVMACDLCDLESVRAFARDFKAKHGGQLDVLVNNAGLGMNFGNVSTKDGLETVFGGNFTGHFCLTTELMPLILSTPKSRVICLSSVFHHVSGTNWEAAVGGVLKRWAYPESKLAMVLFAKELRRRFVAAGSSATAFAVNPGVVRSDIYRECPKLVFPVFDLFMRLAFLNVDQGCCPSVCAASWPLEKLHGSDYYQPYWMPFSLYFPFLGELIAPFVGCAPATPSLPEDEPAASAELWTACERVIQAAGNARGDAPSAVRG